MNNLIELLPFIVGGAEVLTRILPTKKNYSPVHRILKTLLDISSFFNQEKKPGKINRSIQVIIFITIVSVLVSCSVSKKVNCVSSKTVPVVIVTGDSNYYTINVPYCDTIRINKKDTLKLNSNVRSINL
ncbi:MAG TPA: hypothetical protein VF487_13175 [Chitinophagaceae bacterium]